MKAVWSILGVLTLLGGLALPAGAYEEDRVTIKFKLKLKGTAQKGAVFRVGYAVPMPSGDNAEGGVTFCGDPDWPGRDDVCVGGGKVYKVVTTLSPGERLLYVVGRYDGREDAACAGEITAKEDVTITAVYQFGGAQYCEGEVPTSVPNTGAGGSAGRDLPVGSAAAALSLLVVGAYAVRRGGV